MISKLLKLAGGSSALWIYGAVLAAGIFAGGYGVHKLYQASQVGQLKAEISRIQEQSDERVLLAQQAALATAARDLRRRMAQIKVKAHVSTNSDCNLPADATRLLNIGRQ